MTTTGNIYIWVNIIALSHHELAPQFEMTRDWRRLLLNGRRLLLLLALTVTHHLDPLPLLGVILFRLVLGLIRFFFGLNKSLGTLHLLVGILLVCLSTRPRMWPTMELTATTMV